jgi:hypothetical protein
LEAFIKILLLNYYHYHHYNYRLIQRLGSLVCFDSASVNDLVLSILFLVYTNFLSFLKVDNVEVVFLFYYLAPILNVLAMYLFSLL